MKNDTQEAFLRVRGDNDFSEERYDRAVNMFLNEYPSGDIRLGKRRLAGYKPHKKKRTKKKPSDLVLLSDSDNSDTEKVEEEEEEEELDTSVANLSEISSDDDQWTSSSNSECDT